MLFFLIDKPAMDLTKKNISQASKSIQIFNSVNVSIKKQCDRVMTNKQGMKIQDECSAWLITAGAVQTETLNLHTPGEFPSGSSPSRHSNSNLLSE